MADADTPKGGPVERLDLLGAIIDDNRARLIHMKVGRHILKRYYAKFGNARASVGFLQEATGLTRGSVAQATEDLVAWGYFTRIMGSGKRPTEYRPNFSVLSSQDASSVLQPQDDRNSWVRPPQDDRVLQPQDAKGDSVLQLQEQTHLRSAATHAATVNDTSSPVSAQGLAAAPAGQAVRKLLKLIVKSAVLDEAHEESSLFICFEDQDGEEHEDDIVISSNKYDRQKEGQERFTEMLIAMDANEVNNASELVGCQVDAAWINYELRFITKEVVPRKSKFEAWNIAA